MSTDELPKKCLLKIIHILSCNHLFPSKNSNHNGFLNFLSLNAKTCIRIIARPFSYRYTYKCTSCNRFNSLLWSSCRWAQKDVFSNIIHILSCIKYITFTLHHLLAISFEKIPTNMIFPVFYYLMPKHVSGSLLGLSATRTRAPLADWVQLPAFTFHSQCLILFPWRLFSPLEELKIKATSASPNGLLQSTHLFFFIFSVLSLETNLHCGRCRCTQQEVITKTTRSNFIICVKISPLQLVLRKVCLICRWSTACSG